MNLSQELDPTHVDDVMDIMDEYVDKWQLVDVIPFDEFLDMKMDLIDYFADLETKGGARSGLGMEFVTHLDYQFKDLIETSKQLP